VIITAFFFASESLEPPGVRTGVVLLNDEPVQAHRSFRPVPASL